MSITYIVLYHIERKSCKISKKRKGAGGGETKIYTICNYRLDTIERCGCNFGFLPSQMAEKV